MCGIAGFLNWQGRGQDEIRQVADSMTRRLAHRGPDDSGVWSDPSAGLALGHRRLSILDLSPAGHQPMFSACGRFGVVYNGEIYNHQDVRRSLEAAGITIRSSCDTEVLLEAIAHWGLDRTLPQLTGMFAFALWDSRERKLTLVRDRLGIKPLYYGWMDGCLLFASELKAIRAHPAFDGEVDRQSLALYLRHSYIPAPYSIYRGIQKLPPGSYLCVRADQTAGQEQRNTWWSMEDTAVRGTHQRFRGTDKEAVAELDRQLREAVALRMKADVPLGAFLSGGMDSSTVVALMQSQSERSVLTFSIGFEEAGYDEAPHARAVAEHLGTDHTECYVTAEEARDVIPQLPEMYDEPFADPSQIPTYLVSRLARQDVKVCLSGDGGDELFCGYDRYDFMHRLWQRIGWCPRTLRQIAARTASATAGWLGETSLLRRKLNTFSELTSAADRAEFYHCFHSHWRHPESVVACLPDRETGELPALYRVKFNNYLEQMMHIDSVTYLPEDILAKVDRASMAVALEVRVPVLDHRLVEVAWSLPMTMKVRGGESKWLLRRVLEQYVPRRLTDRPKMGFGVPIGDWLRGPLRPWAEALLAPQRLQAEGFLHPRPITEKWQQHLSGDHDWQYLLWDVLMFQAWLERQAE